DGNALAYDFDSGSAANDAIPLAPPDLGLGAGEGFAAHGDSGGPGFLRNTALNRWEIAGIVSRNLATASPPDVNHYVDGGGSASPDTTFGEIDVNTRVSRYVGSFINPTLNPAGQYDLVLDMNRQVLGLDGVTEHVFITALRNGDNLDLVVTTDQGPDPSAGTYFRGPVAAI